MSSANLLPTVQRAAQPCAAGPDFVCRRMTHLLALQSQQDLARDWPRHRPSLPVRGERVPWSQPSALLGPRGRWGSLGGDEQ